MIFDVPLAASQTRKATMRRLFFLLGFLALFAVAATPRAARACPS